MAEKMDVYTKQIGIDIPQVITESKWKTANEKLAERLMEKLNRTLSSRNGMTLNILIRDLKAIGLKGDYDAIMTLKSNKLIAEIGL